MLGLVLFLFLSPPLHFDADACDMGGGEDAVPWVLNISYSLDPFGLLNECKT